MASQRNESPRVERPSARSRPCPGPRAAFTRAAFTRAAFTRAAFTLLEVIATIALAALLSVIALPRTMRLMDRIVVRAAVDAIASACALARSAAVMRGTIVDVTIDTQRRSVRVVAGADTLLDRPLDPGGPLTLSASRDLVRYAPTGLGYGASNTTVIARRRAAADTLFTSRLGRVRH